MDTPVSDRKDGARTRGRHRVARILLRVAIGVLAVVMAAPVGLLIAFQIANRINGSLVSSGETRRYLLHVPDSYDGSPVPLVVDLHGFAQWPANQASVSRWSRLADREGFIVVHPMGTGLPLRWASHTPGSEETSRDVRFLTDLIDHLAAEYAIDPARVFVSGISNGGGMAFVMSCEASGRVAAIGTVAGLFTYPWDACERERPVPLIAFHGTADPIVPFEGGPLGRPGGEAPDVRAWVSDYAARNACTSADPLPVHGAASGTRWSGCDQGADVVLHILRGGGHTWPGGGRLPEFITGPTLADIDATRTMWDFFSQHPLPVGDLS